MHAKGIRDQDEAVKWFHAAAEQGLAAAQNNLGVLYYTGTGVDLDYGESAKWLRLAAEQGFAIAQTHLGYLYEKGTGVPLDYVAAYIWYSVAAAGGDSRSGREMKELSRLMPPKQLAEAKARAALASQRWPNRPEFSSVGAASFFPSH